MFWIIQLNKNDQLYSSLITFIIRFGIYIWKDAQIKFWRNYCKKGQSMHACNTWTFHYNKNFSIIAINQKEEVAVFIIQILRFIIYYTNLYLQYNNHSTIFYGIMYTTEESSFMSTQYGIYVNYSKF